jgi:peptide/nickel transport system permease protein
MAIYIVRRLLWVVLLLFVITLVTFVIFNVLPAGDPAALRAGRQPSAELIAAIRQQLGLDDSYPVQFIRYIGDILPFVGGDGVNFGFSYQNNAEVLPQILDRLPATIFLTLGAVVLWLAVAIPIGMISAVRSGSLLDRVTMGVALIAISAPVYFLGLIALYLFADDIGRFRSSRATPPTRRPTASSARPAPCSCRGPCWRPRSPRSTPASCAET